MRDAEHRSRRRPIARVTASAVAVLALVLVGLLPLSGHVAAATTYSRNLFVGKGFVYQDPYYTACTAASVMHMLNTIAYRGTGGHGFRWKPYTVKKSSNPDQLRDMTSILAFERRNDTLRSSTSGSDAHGWRNALNYYGWGSSAMTERRDPALRGPRLLHVSFRDEGGGPRDRAARHARRGARVGRRPCAGDHGLRGHGRGPEDVVGLHDPVAVPVRPAQVQRDRQPQDELRRDEGRGAQVALPVVPRDRQPVRRPVHERLDPKLREADHRAVRVVPQVGPGAPGPPWPAAARNPRRPRPRRPSRPHSASQQPDVAPEREAAPDDGTCVAERRPSRLRRRAAPSPSAPPSASPSPIGGAVSLGATSSDRATNRSTDGPANRAAYATPTPTPAASPSAEASPSASASASP